MKDSQQLKSLEETVQNLERRLCAAQDDYEGIYADLIAARAALAARNEIADEEAKRRRAAFIVLRGSLGAIPAALAGGYRRLRDRLPGGKHRVLVLSGGATAAVAGVAAAAFALSPPGQDRGSGGNVPTAAAPAAPSSPPMAAPSTTAASPAPGTSTRALEPPGGAAPLDSTTPAPRPEAPDDPAPQATPGPAAAQPGTGQHRTGNPRQPPDPAQPPAQPPPPQQDPPEEPPATNPPSSQPPPTKPHKRFCLLRIRLDPLIRLRICFPR